MPMRPAKKLNPFINSEAEEVDADGDEESEGFDEQQSDGESESSGIDALDVGVHARTNHELSLVEEHPLISNLIAKYCRPADHSTRPTESTPAPSNQQERGPTERGGSTAKTLFVPRVRTWIRLTRGRYRHDIAIIKAVNVVTGRIEVYVVPRFDSLTTSLKRTYSGKPVRPPQQLFNPVLFASEDGSSSVVEEQGRSLLHIVGQRSRIFEGGFEVVRTSSYSPHDTLPTHEEFQIFLINNCPGLWSLESSNDLSRRTALALAPRLAVGDRCQVVAGPYVGLIGSILELVGDHTSACLSMEGELSQMEAVVSELAREFRIGDQVKVEMGRYRGMTGWVTQVGDSVITVFPDGPEITDYLSVDPIYLSFFSAPFSTIPLPPTTIAPLRTVLTPGDPCTVVHGRYHGHFVTVRQVFGDGKMALVAFQDSPAEIAILSDHLSCCATDARPPDVSDRVTGPNALFKGWEVVVIGKHELKGRRGVIKTFEGEDAASVEIGAHLIHSKRQTQIPILNLASYCVNHRSLHPLSEVRRLEKSSLEHAVPEAEVPGTPRPSSPIPDDVSPAWNPSSATPSEPLSVLSLTEAHPSCSYSASLPPLLEKEKMPPLLSSTSVGQGTPTEPSSSSSVSSGDAPQTMSSTPVWLKDIKKPSKWMLFRVDSRYHITDCDNIWRFIRFTDNGLVFLHLAAQKVPYALANTTIQVPLEALQPLHPHEIDKPFQVLVIDPTHQQFGELHRVFGLDDSPTKYIIGPSYGPKRKHRYKLPSRSMVMLGPL